MQPQNIIEQISAVNNELKEKNRYYIPVDPQEAYDLIVGSKQVDINPNNIRKVLKIQNYIFFRVNLGLNRVESFKRAFPDRCVIGAKSHIGSYQSMKDIGEPLSESTIHVKAKRLENTLLYKKIFSVYAYSMHVAFATDRFRVVQAALEKSLDDEVNDRDRVQYMKVFLEETRAPEEKQEGIVINVGGESISKLEDKLAQIAKKLEGKSAQEILDVIEVEEEEEPKRIENVSR